MAANSKLMGFADSIYCHHVLELVIGKTTESYHINYVDDLQCTIHSFKLPAEPRINKGKAADDHLQLSFYYSWSELTWKNYLPR